MPLSIVAGIVYPGVVELTLTGEADLTTADPLRQAITGAVQSERAVGVLVDLREVSFLDSTTIGVLVYGRRLADEAGIGYQVVNPQAVVRHVLETAGVVDYLSGNPSG